MWKYVSRRIRDTFERSVAQFENRSTVGVVNSSSSSDEKSLCTPSRWFSSYKCLSSCRNDGTNSKRWNFEHRTWIDAITWSSGLIIGWYTSQLIHIKYKYHSNQYQKKCPTLSHIVNSLRPYFICSINNGFHQTSPVRIEKIISTFTPSVHSISNEKIEESEENLTERKNSSENDLGQVLNSIENQLGLAAIENGHYEDGLNLLRSAANRDHAPALYNLGLCYEMGLGVSVNEKMAMELYKSAATLHHPGALYNLGIYYGQGRGGLQQNSETATRLLRLAAVQGQKDAVEALKTLNLNSVEPPAENHADTRILLHNYSAQNNIYIPTQTTLFVDNFNHLKHQNYRATMC